ncbi:MAG: hypothetical protein QOF40_80 [Actinomycetota bacterium]|jgi:hypothetical protein|nr:hypothetical protein [Actinomycetota bacterium]
MVCVAMFALAAVAATAIPAGAADAPSAKFCSAYAKISGASGNNGTSPTPKQAGALVARFKAAAQQAPPSVKSAGNTIVAVLSKIAKISPTNAGDLGKFYASADFRKYGKAIGTFFGYAATCSTN